MRVDSRAALAMPFKMGDVSLHWSSALRYQTSSDPLYASEYLSIGGRYTVQGFDGEATLGGRTGGYWRNSLTLPLHRSFAPYAGVDIGHVTGEAAQGLAGGKLSGGYVGLRGDFAGALSWDAFAGWPLQSPEGFDTSGRAVGFRLSYAF